MLRSARPPSESCIGRRRRPTAPPSGPSSSTKGGPSAPPKGGGAAGPRGQLGPAWWGRGVEAMAPPGDGPAAAPAPRPERTRSRESAPLPPGPARRVRRRARRLLSGVIRPIFYGQLPCRRRHLADRRALGARWRASLPWTIAGGLHLGLILAPTRIRLQTRTDPRRLLKRKPSNRHLQP